MLSAYISYDLLNHLCMTAQKLFLKLSEFIFLTRIIIHHTDYFFCKWVKPRHHIERSQTDFFCNRFSLETLCLYIGDIQGINCIILIDYPSLGVIVHNPLYKALTLYYVNTVSVFIDILILKF